MAIPIAKSLGLNVITNGSASNRDRVLQLGVDRFIDYKTEDSTPTVSTSIRSRKPSVSGLFWVNSVICLLNTDKQTEYRD